MHFSDLERYEKPRSMSLTKGQVKQMMKYDIHEFYRNPHNFDWPPPNFEKWDETGWTPLARAIIVDDKRYIRYAKRWKEKESEWRTPHFIVPYEPKIVPLKKNKSDGTSLKSNSGMNVTIGGKIDKSNVWLKKNSDMNVVASVFREGLDISGKEQQSVRIMEPEIPENSQSPTHKKSKFKKRIHKMQTLYQPKHGESLNITNKGKFRYDF